MKIRSIKQIPNDTVYAMETTSGTFIADGVYHHNCAHCNAWLDKDEMIERYRKAVDYKFGDGTYKRLKTASKMPGSHKLPTKPELMKIIEDSTNQIAEYLDNT